MRPRKVILLINDREQERNCWELVFDSTCFYRVIASASMPWALHAVPEVAVLRGRGLRDNITIIRALLPETRILAISDSKDLDADAKLPAAADMSSIRQALRMLAVRRRGPKRQETPCCPIEAMAISDGMRENA